MRKKYTLNLFIICLILINFLIVVQSIKVKNNQDNYFRLHVVANSNSIDDQIIKLKVSKKITNYLNELYNKNSITIDNDKNKTKKLVTNNINNILEIANNEIKNSSGSYSSCANIGKISYDKKSSEYITMPAGVYDSIQIELGNGNGENFWSLIFPYSYSPDFDINSDSKHLEDQHIEVKSGFLEQIKKIAKSFS